MTTKAATGDASANLGPNEDVKSGNAGANTERQMGAVI